MPAKFLPPRTTTVIRESSTPVKGELLFDVDDGLLYIGDGITIGGIAVGTGGTGSNDSFLLNRTNHTGTQSINTITGLGTAATKNTGLSVGNVVELINDNGIAKLPSIDGSLLTGVVASLYVLEVTNNITLTSTNSTQLVIAKVSTSIINITLPIDPNNNDRVIIVDGNGNDYNTPTGFGLYKVVVNPNISHSIQGYNSIDLDTELSTISLIFKTDRWFIYQATY